jgi:putative pre-16S rRNA nuclease
MTKYLAVDFGERRIGLATSDASGAIATPRRAIERRSDADAIARIAAFARDEEVEHIVFGLPLEADGSFGPMAARARSFARKLEEGTGLRVDLQDERHTSQEAGRRIGPGRRHALDAAAAAVLLEDYLRGRS